MEQNIITKKVGEHFLFSLFFRVTLMKANVILDLNLKKLASGCVLRSESASKGH